MRERSQEYKEEISKEENCVYEITPTKDVESGVMYLRDSQLAKSRA
jgi:hypothetical protein